MFISYAQNFEDVILWRALKHVENGFYIDIGAQDPIVDSVSRGFYEKGWRGVSVEPTATYAGKLRENRPDEEVFQVAIGKGGESIRFFEIPETGLSTGDTDIAQEHRERGFGVLETEVQLLSLAQLFDRVGDRDIHWLKIDVEGMEQSVLESWAPSVKRPWIVVIESTRPMQEEPTFEEWEFMLTEKGYEFVYFDGLNRFYVSEDRRELNKAFGAGPNVFDDFAVSGHASSALAVVLKEQINVCEDRIKASDLQVQASDLQVKASDRRVKEYEERIVAVEESIRKHQEVNDILKAEKDEISHRNNSLLTELQTASASLIQLQSQFSEHVRITDNLQHELAAVYTSRSWKLTVPLRRASLWAGWLTHGTIAWLTFKPGSRPRRVLRRSLFSMLGFVSEHPVLRRSLRRVVRHIPSVEQRLRLVILAGQTPEANHLAVVHSLEHSTETETAREIYDRLQHARKYFASH